MIDTAYTAPAGLRRARLLSLVVGAVAAVLLILGLILDPHQFTRSYLPAWLYWAGISIGCLALVMMQHLSGGVWGATLRRFLEAGAYLLPGMLVLFVPVALRLKDVYPWTHPEVIESNEVLKDKAQFYLTEPAFLVRILIYFVIWSILALLLNRWSGEYDRTADGRLRDRLTRLSGPGMVLFAVTITLASVDLLMSLQPTWYSTIFGVIIAVGMMLSAFAFMIVVLSLLTMRGPLRGVLSGEHFLDLGKLLLAFVIFWTYASFVQFLIIWSGNLPLEIVWYVYRLRGGWQWVGVTLALMQFVLPFFLLLSRGLKSNPRTLILIAGIIVVSQVVNMFWLVVPAFYRSHLTVHWMDPVALIAVGGLWIAAFLWRLGDRPLLPLHVLPLRHPRLHTELEHVGH